MNIANLFGDMYYSPTYYDTSTTTTLTDAQAAGFIATVMLFGLIFVAISYVVYSFILWRIFNKAGVAQWKAWVPIYNTWIMYELGDQQGFWAILMFIPVVNIVAAVFMYIAMYNIGLKLGKEGVFVLLAIFLPIVWLIWLAVDNSTWKGKATAAHKAA
ncbi:MAG TPA: DUF5684 domain-containing protein [Candidatus Saccharimonadales bacterium]